MVPAERRHGELVRLRPHLLERDHIVAAGGQPVPEPAAVCGTDPVDVGGGDAEHGERLRARGRFTPRQRHTAIVASTVRA